VPLTLDMPLFDVIARNETRPRRENEALFDYMNTSARRGISAIRDLLEGWYDNFAATGKADVRSRFRSSDDAQHQGAFFELFWHELLLRSGYRVEVHPTLTDVTTRPDFLVRGDGLPQFYLEATIAMPPGDLSADRRLAEFHDTLNRTNCPDFFLSIEYRGSPSGDIRGRRLRHQLERWVSELDYDKISRLYAAQDYAAVPTYSCSEQGVIFTFSPIPKGPRNRGQPGTRPVGLVAPMDMQLIDTDKDLRASIDGKASKYGQLELPLVVAVNVLADLFDDYFLWNALFGQEFIEVRLQPNGACIDDGVGRRPNGTWRGPSGPRNQIVSAVCAIWQLLPSTLRSRRIELIHNPWAMTPLPQGALAIPEKVISSTDGQVQRRDGRSAADILSVPEDWPIYD
jgi:hypothetical protein